MTIMRRGHLDSAPLEVVDGVPASLKVGLAVQFYVSIQSNSALKLTVLLEKERVQSAEREGNVSEYYKCEMQQINTSIYYSKVLWYGQSKYCKI